MRGSMIESLRSHHIRTARALGLSDWSVVVKHALRGAVLPIVSFTGPAAAALLTGSIIVETIFSWPGLGQLTYSAVQNRDFPLLEGLFLLFSAAVIFSNLAADLLLGYLDPRVKEA